jgi:hypothetical protein
MRLQQYINEEALTRESYISLIKRDCKPFLKNMGDPLYRSLDLKNNFQKKRTRKNRHPVDTPRIMHNLLDNAFKKKFGWKPRSEGVFVSPQKVSGYGANTAYFFPIGKYKYMWSKEIGDLFVELRKRSGFLYDYVSRLQLGESLLPSEIKKIENYVEGSIVNKYTDKNLKGNTSKELMFKCDSYYVMNIALYTIGELMYELFSKETK